MGFSAARLRSESFRSVGRNPFAPYRLQHAGHVGAGGGARGAREFIFKADTVEVYCDTVQRLVQKIQQKSS